MYVCMYVYPTHKASHFHFPQSGREGAGPRRTEPGVKMIRNAFRVLLDVKMTDNCSKLHVGEIKVKAEVSNKYSNMKLNTQVCYLIYAYIFSFLNCWSMKD